MSRRSAKLPAHCGNCAFFSWEEDHAYCEHPAQIDIDDAIQDAWESDEVPSAGVALDDFHADAGSDWEPYDQVCDKHLLRRDARDDYYKKAVDEFTEEFNKKVANNAS